MGHFGILKSWDAADGVGRVVLDEGAETVRVSVSRTKFEGAPGAGLHCEVTAFDDGQPGARRATHVVMLEAARKPPPCEPRDHLTSAVRKSMGSLPEFNAWLAAMPAPDDVTGWTLARIKRSTDFNFGGDLERLFEAHQALTQANGSVFGMALADLQRERTPELLSAVEAALTAWTKMPLSKAVRRRLHRMGERLKLPSLLIEGFVMPVPRCAPLGTTDGLDAAWLARLGRLRRAVSQPQRGNPFVSAGPAQQPDELRPFVFRPHDPTALLDAVLQYEDDSERPFSRTLAALLTVVDGIDVDGNAMLWPISQWDFEGDSVHVGTGESSQGSLTFKRGKQDRVAMETWRVIDRDDDGVVLHKYTSVGAYIDAILDALSPTPDSQSTRT